MNEQRHESLFLAPKSDPTEQEIQSLKFALWVIATERNQFDGPTLEYMQGYRNGQKHLQGIAREALKGWHP